MKAIETDYFKIMQPNPSEPQDKSVKGDCVVRAFAIAGDLTWLEAYDLLAANARKTYNMPNDKHNYDTVFQEFGFKRMKMGLTANRKRTTVEQFCKTHPKGRYILRLAHHLSAVVNGVCYDTWNPARLTIYHYYEFME